MQSYQIVVKTLHGLEDVLEKELNSIGALDIQKHNRAVSFSGNKKLLYEVNYKVRTAISVLMPIATFKVKNEDDLYRGISKINWSIYLNINSTFTISTVVNSQYFKHSKYVAYKSKDAIVDQFRRKTGKRPSIDTKSPDLWINVHIADEKCSVSLDSSGDPLFKRGYRLDGHKAPLNEVLAAGMILISGYNGSQVFVDPMCGSGTLLIEAAMIATNTPAGFFRKSFAFQQWNDYDDDLFNEIKNNIIIKPEIDFDIYGSDYSAPAFVVATKNIQNAGFRKLVKLKKTSIQDLRPPSVAGIIVTNPPYGERISTDDIFEFYGSLGTILKHKYNGYHAWIISSNFEALKKIGLRPSQKHTLFNGKLECKYLKFDLYAGSKKHK